MNLLRLALVLLVGWLLGRWLRLWMERRQTPLPGKNGTDLVKCPKCQTYVAKGASHICGPMALLLFCLLATAPAHADQGGRYMIEVSGTNVVATVEINGIATEKWTLGPGSVAGASLNHWLRQGNNTLTFKAVPAGNAARLTARVYFLGLTASGALNIVTLLEVPDLAKAQRGTTVSFNLSSAPLLDLWRAQNPPAPLTPPAARALVGELQRQIASVMAVGGGIGDIDALKAEQDDLAKAFGGNTATREPLVMGEQNHQDKIEVAQLPAEADILLGSVEGTPLLRIARRDNTPLIMVRQSGQVSAVSAVIVGWVNGAWRVLRRAN